MQQNRLQVYIKYTCVVQKVVFSCEDHIHKVFNAG